MDWSLIIFLLVVLFFGYRGYRNGLLKSLARILSLIAGYSCALLYARPVSTLIESQSQMQGIVALIAASLLLFVGAGMIVSLLFWVIQKLLPEAETASTLSSVGGAAAGALLGLFLAIAIVWTFTFVRDMRPAETLADAVQNKPSRIEAVANKLAGKALSTAMTMGSAKPEVARLSAALIESPAEIAQQAQRLAQSQDLIAFLGNPDNRAVLDAGDPQAVLRLPAFQQLLQNPDLQALARSTGILEQVGGSAASVDEALAIQLTDVWGRAQRAKHDPRVQEILNDAEFQRKIQSGNPIDLLTNKRLLELADIIFAEESRAAGDSPESSVATQPQSGGNNTQQSSQPQSDSNKDSNIKFYRWTDKDGRVHYTNVKPDS